MNLCSTLWQTFNKLKSSYEEAKRFLDEGENLSLQQYTEAHATLRKAYDDYQKSFYINIEDIGEVFILDYLNLEQLCQINNLSFEKILAKQEDGFVENRRVVNFDLSPFPSFKENSNSTVINKSFQQRITVFDNKWFKFESFFARKTNHCFNIKSYHKYFC